MPRSSLAAEPHAGVPSVEDVEKCQMADEDVLEVQVQDAFSRLSARAGLGGARRWQAQGGPDQVDARALGAGALGEPGGLSAGPLLIIIINYC